MGDKGETSVNSCGPRNPEWETSVGDKCKLMRPKAPRVGDKCGRQGGDNCKLMRPKAPRVGDKGETSVNSCGPGNPQWETSVGDKWGTSGKGKTSVNSCGPRNPEWETRGRQV